jgi:predicted nucleic acid-binding protein
MLREFMAGRLQLVAPDHIRYELGSALRVASRAQPPWLSGADAEASLDAFGQLGVRMVNDPLLILEGFRVAGLTGCAFYDGLYVALAQRLGIPLITADRKLYERVHQLPQALWIGDRQPP